MAADGITFPMYWGYEELSKIECFRFSITVCKQFFGMLGLGEQYRLPKIQKRQSI